MEIVLDEAAVTKAVNESAVKAVTDSLVSYKVREKLESALAESALLEGIGKVVNEAVAQMDLSSLSTSLANEIARSTASAMSLVLEESVVEIIAKIRGKQYDDVAKTRIKAELRAARDNATKG